MRPLAIDLFCGLGGWTDGLLAEGYDVIGFDIERHVYGEKQYPAQLVLQDVRTIHGRQFKDVVLIVASSPCQKYSYMAMPWTKAKNLAKWYRDEDHPERIDELNELFLQPIRIQREASEAAGKHIPMIQENVRGAIPWVGRSRWNYGSFHLWGDVPALMPIAKRVFKFPEGNAVMTEKGRSAAFQHYDQFRDGLDVKAPSMNWSNRDLKGQDFTRIAGQHSGIKQGGDWFNDSQPSSISRQHSSKSKARKAASATIAKIPLPLARYIANVYHPNKS